MASGPVDGLSEEELARRCLQELLVPRPVPRLPADFTHRLTRRLPPRLVCRPLAARGRRWLRMYWLCAVLISITILLRLDWAGLLHRWPGLAYLGMFLVLLSPLLSLIDDHKVLQRFGGSYEHSMARNQT